MTGFAMNYVYMRQPYGLKDFHSAMVYLLAGRDEDKGRPVPGDASRLMWANEEHTAIGIRYHDTFVITWHRTGEIVLNSGGWRTMTTKKRIGEYLPDGLSLWSEQNEWWLWSKENRTPFADGMTILPSGEIEGAGSIQVIKDRQAERKAIKKYARDFVDALNVGDVPEPSGADCWFCVLRTDDGTPWGEESRNAEHLRSHIEESYFVPSLLLRAMEVGGAGSWYFQEVNRLFDQGCGEQESSFTSNVLNAVRAMLSRYLLRELGHWVGRG